MTPERLRSVLPAVSEVQLENGLSVYALPNPGAGVVASALLYRVGARDDPSGRAGTAHFLEHMMFRGSPHFGPGEIDRQTTALGGANNAFTSHDSTVYYFTFAADRWHRSLAIEADRMVGLTLDPAAVDSERQVVVEEISMYESDPWDALEREVSATAYRGHPYGRAVLGTAPELADIGSHQLAEFHDRHYQPGNAVLVLAGDLGSQWSEEVAKTLGRVELGPSSPSRDSGGPVPARAPRARRLQRFRGDVSRLLMTLPAPPAAARDHARLRLLCAVLALGRSSRLHALLVEEEQLASWISVDVQQTLEPGLLSIAAEVMPTVAPELLEQRILSELERVRRDGFGDDEVERAKKMILADAVLGLQRVSEQAFLVATAVSIADHDYSWRYLEQVLSTSAAELQSVAEQFLDFEGSAVTGWSFAEDRA